MDEMSELCLTIGDNVSPVDDLYTCIDNEDLDSDRPPSVISWSFSPIPDDASYSNNQDFSFVIPDSNPMEDPQPTTDIPTTEPSDPEPVDSLKYHHQQVTAYSPQSNQFDNTDNQITAQMNNYSEYIYPNNITYHHSVNIHNYVGGYCPPVWWDNQSCKMVQNGYEKVPYVQVIEQSCDPLMNIPITSTDLMRCSTPDYLMALNSLNQMDSPPRPNYSAAMNFPRSTFDKSNNSVVNSPQQDSGYNSDLNVSPVIQFQDPVKVRRHTSTPNTYPVLQMKPTTPQTIMIPAYQPKVPMCPDDMKPEDIKEQIYQALQNKIPATKTASYQSTLQTAEQLHPISDRLMSVAEFQAAKKNASKQKQTPQQTAPIKRKAEFDVKHPTNSGTCAKKRRHNEPLNQRALEVMNNWYAQNSENPYPTKAEKEQIAKDGGISLAQVKSWFANKRNRSNNTRPKKQKIEMEGRLMEICHQLARDAAKPNKNNAYYIQQLSSIIHS